MNIIGIDVKKRFLRFFLFLSLFTLLTLFYFANVYLFIYLFVRLTHVDLQDRAQ